MKDLFKGSLTIPNLLSFIRLCLIVPFIIFFNNEQTLLAFIVLALSGISDFLDGKIARKYNQISALGKILDPAADKLTQITLAVMLYIKFSTVTSIAMRSFKWVFILFLAKEALMILFSLFMIIIGLRPSAAEFYGKVATFAFYFAMAIIIGFGPEIGAFQNIYVLPEWAVFMLVIISAILTLVALASYIPDTFKLVSEKIRLRNKEKLNETDDLQQVP